MTIIHTIDCTGGMKRKRKVHIPSSEKERGALLYSTALLTIGTAIIHVIGVLDQVPQRDRLAMWLLGSGLLPMAAALALVIIPTRRFLIMMLLVDEAAVLLWMAARTSGLPLEFPLSLTLWRPETFSVLDLFLPAMEGLAVLLLLAQLVRPSWTRAPQVRCIILNTSPTLLFVNLLIQRLFHLLHTITAQNLLTMRTFARILPNKSEYLLVYVV
jgi:hypothetical protein